MASSEGETDILNGGYNANDGGSGRDDAGYGNDASLRDFLARPNPWWLGVGAVDFPTAPQPDTGSSRVNPARRLGFELLDLNDGEDWPNLPTYAGILRPQADDTLQMPPPPVEVPFGRGGGGGGGQAFTRGRASAASRASGRRRGCSPGGRRARGRGPVPAAAPGYIDQVPIDNKNCIRGVMTKKSWKDIIRKYYAATLLVHDREQFMSRIRQLKKQWEFCNKLCFSSGLGRKADGTVEATRVWWDDNTKDRPNCKKFQNGMPVYLDEMDRMFENVAADGSSSFVAAASGPIDCDSSDEADDDDDEEEELPALNTRHKRASSTSTTASTPTKRSKSPAVRAMDTNMREYNNITWKKLDVLTTLWEQRNQAMQQAREAKENKVKLVNKLARECGVTPSGTPLLFQGVIKMLQNETIMDLFIDTEPEGRMIIIKQYAGVNN